MCCHLLIIFGKASKTNLSILQSISVWYSVLVWHDKFSPIDDFTPIMLTKQQRGVRPQNALEKTFPGIMTSTKPNFPLADKFLHKDSLDLQ